jgi:hypothetical protein
MGAEDKFLAVISNRDVNVITFFSVVGFVMTILFAVYLGPQDDPAALLIQTSNASQINVAQNSLGLARTSAGNGYAEQTKLASVKTPLQPVPDADGVAARGLSATDGNWARSERPKNENTVF